MDGTLQSYDGEGNENVNGINKQNKNSARASRFSVNFFGTSCATKTKWKDQSLSSLKNVNGKAINFALSADVEMCKLGFDCENPFSLCMWKPSKRPLLKSRLKFMFHLSNDTKITDVYRF